jgi:hypothetical protein
MGYKRLKPADKIKSLPTKYTSNVLCWDLDWRTPVGMRLAAEVLLLAQDLGGWESLSRQRQILVERAAYLRLQTAAYETAHMKGEALPFDAGTYSNKCNVLLGHLKTLGLDRIAKPVRSFAEAVGWNTDKGRAA